MARVLTILAFMLCLGTAIPVLNVLSPFSSSSQAKVPPSGFNTPLVVGAAGCGSANSAGGYNCSAGLAGATGNTGFFGSVTSSLLVFGNFFAAAQFLVTLSAGVILPGMYVLEWLGGISNIGAVAIAGLVQGLVWMAYAELFFYVVSGRWLE